ncbi:autophagocytosis associated protein [Phakopsora pachyrhizi]|uniref:Autophagy-related protein 3 n=1 Tax=Phakopsora pachyrhizi TaxID=170000 RepID=A0AAV0AG03_PHAPC|nr:autophagocytosis associated protein [Phakopsora pachyrhizi]CAH7667089.1 autophagocytosis associated protein [Phakopsora pachyrhizi]
MQSFQQFTQTHFWAVRDYLAPVLRESKFKEHGRITPEEFVAAGDFLCYKFPTWSWETGDSSKRRDFLPENKQYLISRNVPCLRRASQMVYTDKDEDAETMMSFAAEGAVGEGEDEDWAVTHTTRNSQAVVGDIGDIPDLEPSLNSMTLSSNPIGPSGEQSVPGGEDSIPDMDDIPDIEDELGDSGGVVEPEDDATADQGKGSSTRDEPELEIGQNNPGNLVSVRTYDCLITYDKYYQTPRMWLMGYDEHKSPLTPNQIFSDISSDYAQKTVTIEPFPHLNGINLASVHPCKHSSVMKKVIERMDGSFKEAQQKQPNPGSGSSGKKKGWIGGVVKKAAGAVKDSKDKKASAASSPPRPSPGEAGETEVEGLRVDQYLLVFLKFISSVVPTIEIDSTTSV